MKKLLCLLLLVGLAFISAPQLTAERVLTTADYQEMVYAVEPGAPITFYIPPSERAKLKAVCCDPPGTICGAYCCWRCPDPGKGGGASPNL